MLKFTGRGAAFNPKEGNTSAHIIEGERMLLLDCGESTFCDLQKNGILNSVSDIDLLLSHTHSDHIGSVPTLALWQHFAKKKNLNILLDGNAKHIKDIEKLLELSGVMPNMVNFTEAKTIDSKYNGVGNVKYVPTDHCNKLKAHGFEFETKNGINYFSGDTRETTQVTDLIKSGRKIDKIYMDTSTADYPGFVHVPLRVLDADIPKQFRKNIFCMHLNNDDCIKQAQDFGFNVVQNIKEKGDE